jgi:hypothetical protein
VTHASALPVIAGALCHIEISNFDIPSGFGILAGDEPAEGTFANAPLLRDDANMDGHGARPFVISRNIHFSLSCKNDIFKYDFFQEDYEEG